MDETVQAVSAQEQLRRGERIESLSKRDIEAVAKLMFSNAAEGGQCLLDLMAKAKKMQLLWKQVEDQCKVRSLEDVRKFGTAGTSRLGVVLAVGETGVSYDFSGDKYWQQLKGEVEAATKTLAAHEAMLKTIPLGGLGITIPSTGETYHAHAPAKRATDVVKATVK